MSCVYFVENSGYVKIGYSRNDDPESRLSSMFTNAPHAPMSMGYYTFKNLDDAKCFEKLLHSHFSFCHYRGEWFEANPVLSWLYDDFMNENPPDFARDLFNELDDWSCCINIEPDSEMSHYIPIIDDFILGQDENFKEEMRQITQGESNA